VVSILHMVLWYDAQEPGSKSNYLVNAAVYAGSLIDPDVGEKDLGRVSVVGDIGLGRVVSCPKAGRRDDLEAGVVVGTHYTDYG
jgi:hypothetical protein